MRITAISFQKIVCCKSARSSCIKHYCDRRPFISETFFYAKNEDKIACFCQCCWTLKAGISRFATEYMNYKIPLKSGFPVGVWNAKISVTYQWRQLLSHCNPAS